MSSVVPVCPTHNKEMRVGKGGSYFCATPISKNPDGSIIWCKYKPNGEETQDKLVNEVAGNSNGSLGQVPKTATQINLNNLESDVRGKVRNNVAVAFISRLPGELTPTIAAKMVPWVDWIMNETFSELPSEDVNPKELDDILK